MKEIIFLSGKRYVGKTSTAQIIKNGIENKGKNATIMSFSYLVKKTYCQKNGLDLNRFLTDHAYKDSHRVPMTQYFASTDQMIYAEYLHKQIQEGEREGKGNERKEGKDFDVYIVDDLRLLMHVEYINKVMEKDYNVTIIRVNSDEKNRTKRGWIESVYDQEPFETEMDNYKHFDYILHNNGLFADYKKEIKDLI